MIKSLKKYVYIFTLFSMLVFSMDTIIPIEGPVAAIPIDAVSGILAAFETHSVVALGEGNHNNEQGHAFRLSLIRDPRFSAIVNDIVVEFGNARYQDIMDRFVGGEEVPDADICKVWQNTTCPHPIWDVPIYEEFFRTVRAVNLTLPKQRQLRVLLGDPPIDWDNPNGSDWNKLISERDSHPAELIQKEVIAKARRALVIYGDNHFLRHAIRFIGVTDNTLSEVIDTPSLVTLLERTRTKVFTIKTYTDGEDIGTLQPDIQTWPQPSLAKLHGTILGAQDYGFYYPGEVMWKKINDTVQSFKVRPGLRMEEQFDAFLYIGPLSGITMSELTVELCSDLAYVEMRKRRMALGGNFYGAENFQKSCDEKMRIGVERK